MKTRASRAKSLGSIIAILALSVTLGNVSAAGLQEAPFAGLEEASVAGPEKASVAAPDDYALKAELANLLVCYARGADAIGDARSNRDPEGAGLAIFRECFTDDATFAVWPAGQPFDKPEFPTRVGPMPPLLILPGPAAWAKFTNTSFRSSGYDYVQHLVGNIVVKVSGNNATVVGYLNSTHVVMGEGLLAPSRCMQQTNGTYSLKVRKLASGWKVTSLDLAQFAYNTIVETGDGCA